MRISIPGIKMSSGNISILTTAAIPVMIVLVLLLYDAGRILVARSRVSAAADRAAYAGAAVLADGMNGIARENWMIHSAWQKLEADFKRDTQKNRDTAMNRIGEYENARDISRARMDLIGQKMFGRASEVALSLLAKNAPHAEGLTFPGGEILLSDDLRPDEQYGSVSYNYVVGSDYIDPEKIENGAYRGLKFRIKNGAPGAAIGIVAQETVSGLLLGKRFGRAEAVITATSAAQAFGGSIENFAKKDAGTVDEAAGVSTGGVDELYHPVLIPGWVVGGF